VIREPGPPEVLEEAIVPDPAPGPGEVLVQVKAAGLNRADLLQRRGLYPAPDGSPSSIPGLEFAGEVVSAGERVQAPLPGARVMGIVGGGAQAERLVVRASHCLPVPPSFSWEEAAGIPEAFMTAWDALFLQGRLQPGESVLIHAAGSGVGTAAIQLSTAAGCTSIGLSRTPGKRALLKAVSAAEALDPGDADLLEKIRRASAPNGVDLILDLVGSSAVPLNLRALRPGGRWVLIGLLGGGRAEIDLGALLTRRLTMIGSTLRARTPDEKGTLSDRFRRQVLPLLARGLVRPVLDRTLPVSAVQEAHQVMERNENFGKIVLRMDGWKNF